MGIFLLRGLVTSEAHRNLRTLLGTQRALYTLDTDRAEASWACPAQRPQGHAQFPSLQLSQRSDGRDWRLFFYRAEASWACPVIVVSLSPTQPAFRRKGLAPILLTRRRLVDMPCNCVIRLSNSASVERRVAVECRVFYWQPVFMALNTKVTCMNHYTCTYEDAITVQCSK